ncbi:NAD(P)-dependent oxidoreductase [Cryobacterium sp. Y82]|uniref:NAD(P)-dependent oxidoreductase n=1 Tax=Cryobacterium sp. Y82 TaxID=2045017 RepID=UPI000CE32935|nr:NAD(P)-dependent oxidoreductase [Cryobacterium sp. Y82]
MVRDSGRPLMGTVLVTSRSFSSGSIDEVGRLADAGHTVVTASPSHDIAELRALLPDAIGWIAGTGVITRQHLDAAPHLRVIARYGVGVESVDIAAAAEQGIVVTNTPGANSDAVADHAVGLMLAILRGTTAGDRRVRANDWSMLRGRELGALSVGIIGFGRIGQGVARRLQGFGSRILAHDPWLGDDAVFKAGAVPQGILAMASECDLVTLHSPGGASIITNEWLARTRPGIVIVNTARPELIDEPALAQALRAQSVGGFAADTLAGDARGLSSPLLAADLADRVIVTPHIGAQTVQAVDNMGSMAVNNLLAVLAGDPPANPVSTKA